MLELQNLSIRAGDFIVGNISLSIVNGSIHVILGPSGSGKTVLIETIAGFHRPWKGRVLLEGADITEHAPELRNMAYVPQDLALFPHMTVRENICFGPTARGNKGRALEETADAVAEALYIKTHYNRNIATLSGGEKQRVALARALVTGNRIILLDEPFSGLHPGLRKEFWFLIKKLQTKHHLTVIVITHDLEEAFFLGDYITILINGSVHQSAAKEDARVPRDKTVASLYGIRNIFRALSKDGQLMIPELNLAMPIPDSRPAGRNGTQELDVGIRAEDLIIYDRERMDGLLRASPEVTTMPTVTGEITDCFERGNSATLIFSPRNSALSLEIEIPYHKVQKLLGVNSKDIAVALPPDRLFILAPPPEYPLPE